MESYSYAAFEEKNEKRYIIENVAKSKLSLIELFSNDFFY